MYIVGNEDHESRPFLGMKRQRSVIVKNKNDLKNQYALQYKTYATQLAQYGRGKLTPERQRARQSGLQRHQKMRDQMLDLENTK